VAVVIGGLLLGGWLWLRDSSLVAVTRVTVSGESGPDAAAIRTALIGAAHGMTTLDVSTSQLRTAVSPFPVVEDLRVSTQFPHGMRIRVIERLPVAVVSVAGRNVAVANDGTLLHELAGGSTLPVVPLTVPPGGPRLIDPALQAIKLLAAAPAPFLARISQVTTVAGHGLVAQVRGGPSIYFGLATDARAKWIAATEVLADPGSAGAAYIDVTDPVRPAAGAAGSSGAAGGSSSSAAGASSSSAATSPSGSVGTPGG
jgi:cell division protein FtsQ